MTIKLLGIGGMGLMLSPSARHLKADGPARFIRIFDRGTADKRRDQARQSWKAHGAALVSDYDSLVGDGDYDGVVICAGKNGDDCNIFRSLVPCMVNSKNSSNRQERPFIAHLSTVSSGFAQSASEFLNSKDIDYVNYPLTGGPLGAENAAMLILASGSESLYQRLEPMLGVIGKPKYFGSSVTAGADVKLIGQLMVFNGLTGISSAAALKSECFSEQLSGETQAEFFDFLNAGAGGTRQWDVALSKGVRDDIWDQGFMIQHAVVDAIYAAKLCQQRGLPAFSTVPMIAIAQTFAYLLNKYDNTALATHAIVREMISENASGLNAFINQHISYDNINEGISKCIEVLPEQVKASVLLDINRDSFTA